MPKKLAFGQVHRELTDAQAAEFEELAKEKGFQNGLAFLISLVKGELFLARLNKADPREAIAAQLNEEFSG